MDLLWEYLTKVNLANAHWAIRYSRMIGVISFGFGSIMLIASGVSYIVFARKEDAFSVQSISQTGDNQGFVGVNKGNVTIGNSKELLEAQKVANLKIEEIAYRLSNSSGNDDVSEELAKQALILFQQGKFDDSLKLIQQFAHRSKHWKLDQVGPSSAAVIGLSATINRDLKGSIVWFKRALSVVDPLSVIQTARIKLFLSQSLGLLGDFWRQKKSLKRQELLHIETRIVPITICCFQVC